MMQVCKCKQINLNIIDIFPSLFLPSNFKVWVFFFLQFTWQSKLSLFTASVHVKTPDNVCWSAFRVDSFRINGGLLTRKSRSFSSLWERSARRLRSSRKRSASWTRKGATSSPLITCCRPCPPANGSKELQVSCKSPSPSPGPIEND